ncbi:MAG: cold-shock protein [bacterium]
MAHSIFKKVKKVKPDQEKNDGEKRKSGTIKWLNREKGYGIVNYDQGEEAFVHYDPIYGKDYHSLRKDDRADILPSQRRQKQHVPAKHEEHRSRVTKPTHYHGIK